MPALILSKGGPLRYPSSLLVGLPPPNYSCFVRSSLDSAANQVLCKANMRGNKKGQLRRQAAIIKCFTCSPLNDERVRERKSRPLLQNRRSTCFFSFLSAFLFLSSGTFREEDCFIFRPKKPLRFGPGEGRRRSLLSSRFFLLGCKSSSPLSSSYQSLLQIEP